MKEHTYKFHPAGQVSCTTCGAHNNELTTHCPGHRMSLNERHDVRTGRRDYRRGQWVDTSGRS